MKRCLLFAAAAALFLALAFPAAAVWPKRVVLGEKTDITGFDPAVRDMPEPVRPLLYNCLVELDADFTLKPGLAVRWESSADGKSWTFHLRPGVRFHDGTPCDAEAVRYNFDRLRDRQRGGPQQSWLAPLDAVVVLDETTVRFDLKSPQFAFDSDLTPPFLSIAAPSAFGPDGKVRAAVGTGPFTLAAWEKGRDCVLRANDAYWGGRPAVDEVVIRHIKDPDARAMALASGAVDMIDLRGALTAAEQVRRNPKLALLKRMGQTSEVIFCNTDKGPLADASVRAALARGIDVGNMVSKLLGVNAEPGRLFFSPAFGEYVSPSPYAPAYAPKEAAGILDSAGWTTGGDGMRAKDGRRLELSLLVAASNAEDMLLAAAIQDALRPLGCALRLVPLENAALLKAFTDKDHDMLMLGQWLIPHNEPYPHYLRGYFHSRSAYTVYHSPELDALIDRLTGTRDKKERVALHHAIQEKIAGAMPFLMLFHRNNVMGVKKELADYPLPVGSWQLYRGLARPAAP